MNRPVLKTFFLFSFLALNSYGVVKNLYGGFSARHNDLYSKINDVEGNNYWFDFDLKYHYKKPFIDKEGKVDFSIRFNDASHFMFSVKEAQLTHLWKNQELSYGRLLVDWVEIDKIWGLGKVNNLENFDFFRPGQEGLTGIKYGYRFSQFFDAQLFGSFIYVPQLNPPLGIDRNSGTLTPKSPWSQKPVTSVDLGGVPHKVNYNVTYPDILEVLLQPSYGLNLRVSPMDSIHISAFVLRKPENQLSNTAKADINNAQSDITANVETKLFHHTLFGGQITAAIGSNWKLYTSYLASIPGDKADDLVILNNNFGIGITVEKFREDYLGAGVVFETENLKTSAGYLARISEFVRTSQLDSIPKWSQALNVALDYNLDRKYFINFDLKYDTLTFDRLYSLSVGWQPLQHFRLNVGADIIGSPQAGEGYWVSFRENDSYFTELKYVF